MRLAVVIERKNYYRVLGAVVEAALGRRWQVVCLHDYAQPRTGMKASEFPSVQSAPRFRNGTPETTTYRGPDALLDAIERVEADAVISIMPPPGSPGVPRRSTAKWVSLQYSAEILYHFAPSVFGVDRVALYSPWWLDFGLAALRQSGRSVMDDALEKEICRKSVTIGCPELDEFRSVDPRDVRRRWGIPERKPVVVFLPYPFNSNPRTAWSRWVYAPGIQAWKRLRLHLAGEERLKRLVARGWDDAAVVRSVRGFCDGNGAHLVVKARQKDPVPRYLHEVADVTLYDEATHPPTILEALAVADLCIHFYSTAILEAVGVGVASLSICPELDEMGVSGRESQFSRDEGSLYQCHGVAETRTVGEAIETLPSATLADFAVDPVAQAAYVEKFLGAADGKSGARLLDVVEEVVGQCG
jgi:hypothetical protein